LYLASQHYREPWPHNPARLAASEALAQKLRTAVANNPEEFKSGSSEPGQYREAFEDAMDDDLDTPRAIELFSDIADAGLHSPVPGLTTLLLELSSVLGIRLGKDPESDRLQGWDRHRARFDSNG
jgi:cysteinyl-tRNA synthetase